MIADHPLERLAALLGPAAAHALPVHLPRLVKMIVKGVAVPALGLGGRVPGLASRDLAPRTVRGRVDESALAVTRHTPPLPVARPGVTARCRTGHVTALLLLTACSLGRVVGGLDVVAGIARRLLLLPMIAVTFGRQEAARAVAGGSVPLPTSSFTDLVRLFLNLSGPMVQRDAAVGSLLSASGVTGAGVLPGPTTLVTPAAPVACSSVMPAPGVWTPAGKASATTLPSRCEHALESSHPERRHRRSSGRERSRLGGKRGSGQSPSPARSARSASASASSLSESSDAEERVSVMPTSPSGQSGVGGGLSVSDRSASGRDHSLQLALRVWVWVSGPRHSLTGLARNIAVVLPPLLRVWWKTTEIVPPVRLIWIGMIRFGLCFTSSGSSIAWRNRQV